jgi:5-methylcytosine-specific restriction protein A
MQNLLSAVEPGRGLSFSKADKAAVADYPKARKDELAALANSLRASFVLHDGAEELPDDEVFFEGRWLTVRHRQRDQRLRQRLLTKLRGMELRCEMCDVPPPPLDREFQESRYEAHHRIPLAEAEHERETRVADMALLCACCHRTLHKMISRYRRWVSVAEGRSLLGMAP